MPFLSIAALKHGFDALDTLGGMAVRAGARARAHARAQCLWHGGLEAARRCTVRNSAHNARNNTCTNIHANTLSNTHPNTHTQAIEAHVESLRAWGYARLSSLRHANGAPLLRIFGAHAGGPRAQGGIFEFLVLRPDGSAVAGTQARGAAVWLRARAPADEWVWLQRGQKLRSALQGPGGVLGCAVGGCISFNTSSSPPSAPRTPCRYCKTPAAAACTCASGECAPRQWHPGSRLRHAAPVLLLQRAPSACRLPQLNRTPAAARAAPGATATRGSASSTSAFGQRRWAPDGFTGGGPGPRGWAMGHRAPGA